MNSFTKRIGGLVAAGLLTVSGVAMIAQPAYAEGKAPISMSLKSAFKKCRQGGGEPQAVAYGEQTSGDFSCTFKSGTLSCPATGIGTPNSKVQIGIAVCSHEDPAHNSPPVHLLVLNKAGIKAMFNPTIPLSPGSGVIVKPGGSLAPPTTNSSPGTGIVVKPGGAIG